MKYHNAEKHTKVNARVVHKCRISDKEFYSLRERKQKEHGERIDSRAQNVDVAHVMGDVDDNSLKEELEKCNHFFVESEMENRRHRVHNIARILCTLKHLLEKINVVFDSLKCAAKLNVAFSFVLKNVENWSCRYYFAHENNKKPERSKLVATTEALTKIKNLLSNMDVIESCKRERANTEWKLYKLTNVTIFAEILKDVSMGCRATVLPDPPLKTPSIKCLTYEEKIWKL